MQIQRIKLALLAAPMLLSLTLSQAASADPLGYIVNRVMEHVLYSEDSTATPQVTNTIRKLPEKTETGTLSPFIQGNQIKIDGEDHTLAMNSRIRDEHNRIVQTSMVNQEKRIRFTMNNLNQVDRIWFLTPGEE